MKTTLIFGLLAIFGLEAASGQREYPPVLEGVREVVYKTVGERELKLWVVAPEEKPTAEKRVPGVVFFFGGGWRKGTPGQFIEQGKHLAGRGMVAFLADYRVSERDGTKAKDCVEDAKSAMRWVRERAGEFGVDPERLAAGGGSAGGHLAAAVALVPGFDAFGENDELSARPDALLLFNPAVEIPPVEKVGREPQWEEILRERLGCEPAAISPAGFVKDGVKVPPTVIFHGTKDDAVPIGSVRRFRDAVVKFGGRCELEEYGGRPHGFFNFGRGGGKDYRDTVEKMDAFLVSLGWLKGTE